MPVWSDGYISSNGLKIHYYRTGGDKPKVVLNHGGGDDGLCWTRVVKELENDYDVIMVDARGHGKTSSGNGDYSTGQRVNDLAGFIQALGLERPVIGGHSMGADTSMNFAAIHPEQTRGIFLEDPPIILPGERLGNEDQQLDLIGFGKMMAKSMRNFKIMPKPMAIRRARKMSPFYPDVEILPWVDSKERLSFDFLKTIGTVGLDTDAQIEVFKKITVPVLLFTGDTKKMAIVSKESARLVVSVNDRVKVVHLEDATHDIRRTRFDGYLPALKDFLKGIYQP